MEGGLTRRFLSEGEAPFEVWAELCAAGEDIHILVGGGERPHIGAVALAEPAASLHPVTGLPLDRGAADGEACRLTVLSADGHKDALVAELFAEAFCRKFAVNVSASAGIHVDQATGEMIEKLVENAKALLENALRQW